MVKIVVFPLPPEPPIRKQSRATPFRQPHHFAVELQFVETGFVCCEGGEIGLRFFVEAGLLQISLQKRPNRQFSFALVAAKRTRGGDHAREVETGGRNAKDVVLL
jgi:hypothetical protein